MSPSPDAAGPAADAARSNVAIGDDSSAGTALLRPTPPVDASLVDAFAGCATDSQEAQRIPLDLFFMLDTSGSMSDLVADRQSKWTQVTAAIAAFIQDPASAGLGVGLQYFPLRAAGVPESCTADAQCGASGCVTSVCDDGSGATCHSDDDCFPALCAPVAACGNDANTLCTVLGDSCGPDANGFDLGLCGPVTATCANGDSCAAADYETPAVGIASLPGIASAVTRSLAARVPQGATPTSAALQGAIRGARAFAAANPGHTVAAVLATDGMPNEVGEASGDGCATAPQGTGVGPNPADVEVAQIAAAGLVGTPVIKTFGIGVFTPDDIASGTATLDQIASAGGTETPFIIRTEGGGQSVEAQFIAALNAIRGTSLPCQFEVPTPPAGTLQIPDFNAVNIRFTAGNGDVTTIPYVTAASECDRAGGGWYYDADPTQGAVPMAIDTCPATCSSLEDDPSGRVDIVLGCRTVIRVP